MRRRCRPAPTIKNHASRQPRIQRPSPNSRDPAQRKGQPPKNYKKGYTEKLQLTVSQVLPNRKQGLSIVCVCVCRLGKASKLEAEVW